MRTQKVLFTIFLLFFLQIIYSQSVSEGYKSLPIPYPHFVEEQFGKSISADGDYAVIGADHYAGEQGCAYVLFKSGTNWEIIARLKASDGEADDNFGTSVDICGDVIIVGSSKTAIGSAYVFVKPQQGWLNMTETGILSLSSYPGPKNGFGVSVSISENTVLVGATGINSAFIFEKPVEGWGDMTETATLIPSVSNRYDYFGKSLDINGNIAVIASDTAYVFIKPEAGWKNATETAKLIPSDTSTTTYKATSVSISEDLILVGSRTRESTKYAKGAVYVFEKPTGGWHDTNEIAKLIASDGAKGDNFGNSVDISGNVILVGAYLDDGVYPETGSAYIFVRPENGWKDTTETAKLSDTSSLNQARIGSSVCISENQMLVCAPKYRESDGAVWSGAAFIFNEPSEGWTSTAENIKLLPLPELNNAGDWYGNSVAIDGNFAAIGSFRYRDKGCVYVLQKKDGAWSTEAILTASDGKMGDELGDNIAIDNNVIVATSTETNNYAGAAYVFVKPETGWTDTTENAKLTISNAGIFGIRFGSSVSVFNNTVVVGKVGHQTGLWDAAAYVFEKPLGGWINMTETAILTPSDYEVNDNFGCSVDIYDNTIVVGSRWDKQNDVKSGSAYVYNKPESGWENMTETAKLTPSNGILRDAFGTSVSIFEDLIAISAPENENTHAYVFEKPDNGWINDTETAIISDSENDTYNFGETICAAKDMIIVGARGYEKCEVDVFVKPLSGWENIKESYKLESSDINQDGMFGASLALDSNIVVVGSFLDNTNGVEAGAAYFYQLCHTNDTEKPFIYCPDDIVFNIAEQDTAIGILLSNYNKVHWDSVYENCGIKTIFNNFNYKNMLLGEYIPEGITDITWTIVDFADNSNQCNFTVNVSKESTFIKNDNLNKNNKVIIYPNPAHKEILIANNNYKLLDYSIFDLNGKLIKRGRVSSDKQIIDIQNLNVGVYIIKLYSKDAIDSFKLIKH